MSNPLSVRGAAAAACALLFAGLSCTLAVRAQTPLDAVVVTAARSAQRAQDVLPATTVLTRADIDRAQTPSLDELLPRGGIEIARNGGAGAKASLFLRGANSQTWC